MIAFLVGFVRRRWPDFEQLTAFERARLVADVALALLSLPLAVLSLAVLVVVSDREPARSASSGLELAARARRLLGHLCSPGAALGQPVRPRPHRAVPDPVE